MGCPFPMLAKRHNGSGILPFPEEVEKLLEIIHKYYKNDGRDFNILLIGFMGSGKSSVSLKLSELLKMETPIWRDLQLSQRHAGIH